MAGDDDNPFFSMTISFGSSEDHGRNMRNGSFSWARNVLSKGGGRRLLTRFHIRVIFSSPNHFMFAISCQIVVIAWRLTGIL